MKEKTLEERVAALEIEVARLKAGKTQTPSPEDSSKPWWKDILGIYKDCPEFDETMRHGREWRESFATSSSRMTRNVFASV